MRSRTAGDEANSAHDADGGMVAETLLIQSGVLGGLVAGAAEVRGLLAGAPDSYARIRAARFSSTPCQPAPRPLRVRARPPAHTARQAYAHTSKGSLEQLREVWAVSGGVPGRRRQQPHTCGSLRTWPAVPRTAHSSWAAVLACTGRTSCAP